MLIGGGGLGVYFGILRRLNSKGAGLHSTNTINFFRMNFYVKCCFQRLLFEKHITFFFLIEAVFIVLKQGILFFSLKMYTLNFIIWADGFCFVKVLVMLKRKKVDLCFCLKSIIQLIFVFVQTLIKNN